MEPTTLFSSSASWLWDRFGKDLVRKGATTAKTLWERTRWSEKESLYKRHLIAHYSTTKLLGNPKEIRIDDIYTDVHVLDKVAALQRLTIDQLERIHATGKRRTPKGIRKPLREIAAKENRLYILGKPGAGKSTFLRHITLLCCKGIIQKTPIFVSLKAWSDAQCALMVFIEREFAVCAFPSATAFVDRLLETGNAIALFDGLDEVNQEGEKRTRMIGMLTTFARKYPKTQMFITCRVAATDYSSEPVNRFETLTLVHLL